MLVEKRTAYVPALLSLLLLGGLVTSDLRAQTGPSKQERRVVVTSGQEGPAKRVWVDVSDAAKRGYLGVSLEDVTAENKAQLGMTKEEGALVQDVEKDSPAAQAGVLKGDVIVSYAGFPVFSAAQLARYVAETPVGRKVELTVLRAGKKQNMESKIAQRSEKPNIGVEMPDALLRRGAQEPNLRFFGEDGGMFNFGPMRRGVQIESASRPRLGVSVIELTDQLAEKYGVKGKTGVLVSSVNAGSPAEKAGLRAGDVILEANGSGIADAEDLTRSLRRAADGASVELKIYRDGKPMTLTAQLEGPSRKTGGGNRVIL